MREAAELARASIEVMRSIDHLWGVARAELGLGDLARLRGDLDGAQHMYSDALSCLREIGARPEIARCLAGLGRMALDRGDLEAARESPRREPAAEPGHRHAHRDRARP